MCACSDHWKKKVNQEVLKVEEEIGKRSDESIQRHGNWSGSSMEIQTGKNVEGDECSSNIDDKGMLLFIIF